MSRVDDLLARMTIEEKIGQLNMLAAGFSVTGPVLGGDVSGAVRAGRAGSLLNVYGAQATRDIQRIALDESRLRIPLLLGFDVIHGHRTVFPIPLAETGAFDAALWEATARVAAEEATEDGVALTFAPMLDIARDPRWGRMAEGPGEDPLVASLVAFAKIRGFQGASLRTRTALAATAKHFVAYGAASAGRDYASTDMSERSLREVYLPPFEAAARAEVAAVMPAFSDLSGVPMTANGPLMKGWLRDAIGFQGVIVSDYNAVAELVVHGVAADLVHAAALALKAGVDIDMMSNAYDTGLRAALERGLVTLAEIEASVRRVLSLKERLGLFDDPYRDAPVPQAATNDRRALARDAVRRTVTLLQNRGDLLPLDPPPARIAVLGPLADAPTDMMGSWSGAGRAEEVVSILDGLRTCWPNREIAHARGVGVDSDDEAGIERALELARRSDLVVLCVGESRDMSGEAASRGTLDLPGNQSNFARAVLDAGKPTVVLLCSGRPLAVPWLFDKAAAVLALWYGGSETGNGVADLLSGKASPSARLPVTWPRGVGQVPIFFGERPSGRPASPEHYTSKYQDQPTTPLFPFGHGLTYGRIVYAGVRAEPARLAPGEAVLVDVDLRNDGRRAAEETVFLFVRKAVAEVARPLLELKAFTKITLAPSESGRASIALPYQALRFPGPDLAPVVEPGTYDLFVGPSADRSALLSVRIEVVAA